MSNFILQFRFRYILLEVFNKIVNLEKEEDMSISLRNKLFFLIVLFVIFCNIPKMVQLNFLGSFLAKDLSLYPILIGVVYMGYAFYQERKVPFYKEERVLLGYIVTYVFVLMLSFIHGLSMYPYYDAILAGPPDQIEKLPVVQHFLSTVGIEVDTISLLKLWMFARPIKGFIVETVWYFLVPYLIFTWYKRNASEGFSILTRAIFCATVLVCMYGIVDVFYLSGSTLAEKMLVILNPIIHDIKSNGTWWPPLLWKGQLRSLFAEPSYYGLFAAFAMPFLWYYLGKHLQTKNKILITIVLFIFTSCLFLTKARTANVLFIGEIILLICFTLWQRNRDFMKRTVTIVIISSVAFIVSVFSLNFMPGSPQGSTMGYDDEDSIAISSYLEDNVGSLASSNKRSNGARYSILEADISIGKDYPLLGVGKSLRHAYIPDYLSIEGKSNSEVQYWIKNQEEKGIMKSGFPALGEYSTRFAETGVLGLVIYLLPTVFLAWRLLKRIYLSEDREEREKCIFFFISFSGVMASGLGDNLSITCAYWILMGLGYALIASPSKKEQHESA